MSIYYFILVWAALLVVCDETTNLERNPPVITEPERLGELLLDDGLWTGWSLGNPQNEVAIAPITDVRWEGFPINYTDHYTFLVTSDISSISFSIYQPQQTEFTSENQGGRDVFIYEVNDLTLWLNFTILVKDCSIRLHGNTNEFHQVTNICYPRITVKTPVATSWKIYNYQARTATQISESGTNILPRCVVLYVSQCPYCLLRIYRHGELVQELEGTADSTFWPWKQSTLNFSADISLSRNTKDVSSEGYWAVDLRECPVSEHAEDDPVMAYVFGVLMASFIAAGAIYYKYFYIKNEISQKSDDQFLPNQEQTAEHRSDETPEDRSDETPEDTRNQETTSFMGRAHTL